jgi:molybdopterin synthase catalytic subunit
MIRVQRQAFDVGAELRAMVGRNHRVGGVCSFVGIVRDICPQGPVSALTVEHYPGMTEKSLAALEAEAGNRWPLETTLIIHRFGELEPGEPIVLVAAASAHRDAAFEACRFMIDRLKTNAALWKREEGPAGCRWLSPGEALANPGRGG